ncbi:MAG: sortase [Candidatus Shapirobacteria bacterium]|nr:sortase [Candidatus Shapirobacteria bacterium]
MSDPLDFFRVRPKIRVVKIKRKTGTIFTNPTGTKKAVFYVANLFIIISITYLSYLYWPLGEAVIKYWEISKDYQHPALVQTSRGEIPIPTPITDVTDKNQFWIQIPKIQARANIVANVSAANSEEYLKVLENNVIAQASGTALPGAGMGKSMYLFAHSSQQGLSMVRNNAVFYLLGEMNNGDVIFVNFHGKIYTYLVYKQAIVSASEVQYLSYSEPNKEVLILQTCWPIGTDWKRLLVFAQKI